MWPVPLCKTSTTTPGEDRAEGGIRVLQAGAERGLLGGQRDPRRDVSFSFISSFISPSPLPLLLRYILVLFSFVVILSSWVFSSFQFER